MDSSSEKRLPLEIEVPLRDFLLNFIQALAKSSYYHPSHPKSSTARQGVYRLFRKVIDVADEITIYRKTGVSGKEEMLVDIPPHETVALNNLFKSQQARMFIPKYLSIFARKKLVSASLRKDFEENEFIKFVEVLSEYMEETRALGSEDLVKIFVERGVMHATLVFEDEVMGVRRKLPWKVELAISRLRKDLKTIPLFKNKSRDELLEIKRMVLHDIIRPFREAHLISRLLGNIDLAKAGISSFIGENLEEEIIRLLPGGVLPDLVMELIELYEKASELVESEEAQQVVQNIKTSLAHVVVRVVREHSDKWQVFDELLSKGFISWDEIPERAQMYLESRRILEEKLKNWDGFIEEVKGADLSEFTRIGEMILAFSDELEKKKAYREIAMLSEALHDKAEKHFDNPAFAHVARNVIKAFSLREPVIQSLNNLIEEFKNGKVKREEMKSVIRGFASLGENALNLMVKRLEDSNAFTLNQIIVEALAEKSESVPLVLRHLKEPGKPPHVKKALLQVLSLQKARIGQEVVLHLTRDADPGVRASALQTLGSMGVKDLHTAVERALIDPSPQVKSMALLLLPLIKVVTPEIYAGAIQSLASPQVPVEAKLKALQVFERWGNKTFPDGETTEEKLLSLLEKNLKSSRSEEIPVKEIVEIIIKTGTRKGKKFLKQNRSKLPPDAQKAVDRLLA